MMLCVFGDGPFTEVHFELFGFVPLEFTVLNEFVGFVPLVFIKVLCFCSCLCV